jgi:hypothetical protein
MELPELPLNFALDFVNIIFSEHQINKAPKKLLK